MPTIQELPEDARLELCAIRAKYRDIEKPAKQRHKEHRVAADAYVNALTAFRDRHMPAGAGGAGILSGEDLATSIAGEDDEMGRFLQLPAPPEMSDAERSIERFWMALPPGARRGDVAADWARVTRLKDVYYGLRRKVYALDLSEEPQQLVGERERGLRGWVRTWRESLRKDANIDPIFDLSSGPWGDVELRVYWNESAVADTIEHADAVSALQEIRAAGVRLAEPTINDLLRQDSQNEGSFLRDMETERVTGKAPTRFRSARLLVSGRPGPKEHTAADDDARWTLGKLFKAYPDETAQVVRGLKPKQVEVLELYFAKHLLQREVADALWIGQDAVNKRITRIRKAFTKAGLPEPKHVSEGRDIASLGTLRDDF